MILQDTDLIFWQVGTDARGRLTANVVGAGPADEVFVNVAGVSRRIKISTVGRFGSEVVTFNSVYPSSERISSSALITTDSLGRPRAIIQPPIGVVVFAADPDWSEPIRERKVYLTDIITSYDAHEQRIQIRKTPRTILTYKLLTLDRRESATVEAQICGAQGQVMGVPYWPDLQPLIAAAGIGETEIEVDTTFRSFTAGGLVLLWRDLYTYEVAEIATVNDASLGLAGGLVVSWAAQGTYVMPLLKGRLPDSQTLNFLTNSVDDLEVTFECGDPELNESAPGVGAGVPDAPELHECPA